MAFAPDLLLSTTHAPMRRGQPVLNGSLTIIVLTLLTTFSALVRNPVGKRLNSLG
jgi:hypothetical protein